MSESVARVRALIADGRTEDAEQVLRTAADDGDTAAGRELGRLLTLTGVQWYESFIYDPEQPWEAEERLARAVEDEQQGTEAALTLAGLNAHALIQVGRNDFTWLHGGDTEKRERWRSRFRDRAAALYDRVLAADPACAAAASAAVALLQEDWGQHQLAVDGRSDGRLLRRGDPVGARLMDDLAVAAERALAIDPEDAVAVAGLAEAAWARWDDEGARHWYRRLWSLAPGDELAERRLAKLGEPLPEPAEPTGYGFALLTVAAVADHHDGVLEESIVLSDPVDLRWAIAGMLNMHEDAPVESCEMRVYHRGRPVQAEQPADERSVLDWAAEAVPDALPEPLLPWGHPVRVDSRTYQHGYNLTPPL